MTGLFVAVVTVALLLAMGVYSHATYGNARRRAGKFDQDEDAPERPVAPSRRSARRAAPSTVIHAKHVHIYLGHEMTPTPGIGAAPAGTRSDLGYEGEEMPMQ